MKEKVIKPSDVITISQSPKKIEEAFDVSNIEKISKTDLVSLYTKYFTLHKGNVLNLVMSRIALDSAMVSVEKAVEEHMAGSAISVTDADAVDKLDDVFDKALVMYAFDSALSEVITDPELRREYIIGNADKLKVPSPAVKDKEKHPLGMVSSRDPASQTKNIIDKIEQIVRDKIGNSDDAPTPYGHTKKPDKPTDGKLRTAGTVTRKGRRRGK